MLTLLPQLLCSPSPPFCFPVTPAAEFQLPSLSRGGISALRRQVDAVVLGQRRGPGGTGQEQPGSTKAQRGARPPRGMFHIPPPARSGSAQWPIPLSGNTAADSLLYKYWDILKVKGKTHTTLTVL